METDARLNGVLLLHSVFPGTTAKIVDDKCQYFQPRSCQQFIPNSASAGDGMWTALLVGDGG
jgi:hypothetical protein